MTAGDCGSSTHTKEEISRIRHAEARAAADYLGAWYACAGFLDLEVFTNVESVRRSPPSSWVWMVYGSLRNSFDITIGLPCCDRKNSLSRWMTVASTGPPRTPE